MSGKGSVTLKLFNLCCGISDGEITAAMEEKLKVNMARQWPEPKDGEPRLHIKSDQRQEHK